jgi:hypothetical protein
MIVLDYICKKCNEICNALYFQQNFGNWTSGNSDIDNFIRDTQSLTHKSSEISHALEWIPYDRFYNIKYIAENEFGQVFRANWIDGSIDYWNDSDKTLKRKDRNMFVILESLDNSKIITLEFMNKVFLIHYL